MPKRGSSRKSSQDLDDDDRISDRSASSMKPPSPASTEDKLQSVDEGNVSALKLELLSLTRGDLKRLRIRTFIFVAMWFEC